MQFDAEYLKQKKATQRAIEKEVSIRIKKQKYNILMFMFILQCIQTAFLITIWFYTSIILNK